MQQHVLMMRDRISCELGTRAGSVIINKTEISPQAACSVLEIPTSRSQP